MIKYYALLGAEQPGLNISNSFSHTGMHRISRVIERCGKYSGGSGSFMGSVPKTKMLRHHHYVPSSVRL